MFKKSLHFFWDFFTDCKFVLQKTYNIKRFVQENAEIELVSSQFSFTEGLLLMRLGMFILQINPMTKFMFETGKPIKLKNFLDKNRKS